MSSSSSRSETSLGLSLPVGVNPYYDKDGILIINADCRDILPHLDPVDLVLTDPVWPDAQPALAGKDDPTGLLTEALSRAKAERVVVHLGCDTDPRMLTAVPTRWPFLRVCWLRYARPHYKGRVLYGSDVAYVFGFAPPSEAGARVMPGEFCRTDANGRVTRHPCERPEAFVKWLVRWFARGPVLDPFMGSGTTLVAARDLGRRAIGIEIEERYCAIAVDRLRQGVLPFVTEHQAG